MGETNRALIFDFDGLILDTETATFEVWKQFYAGQQAELTLEEWLKAVGHVDNFDPRAHLEKVSGASFNWPVVEADLRQRILKIVGQLPVLPGVAELIQQATKEGMRTGVASNSDRQWVEEGLAICGLRESIEVVRTRDDVDRYKPHPDVYLSVLEALAADPQLSIAFEDSAPGVAAAKAAGLYVVAVPNALTRYHDLSAADVVVESLQGFKLPKLAECRAAVADKAG